MLSRSVLRLCAAVCVWAASFQAAHAQFFFAGSESMGYVGNWTAYNTLADALSGANAVGSGAVAQHDMSLYIDKTQPFTLANPLQSLYYSPSSANAGSNPVGFLGVYNSDPTKQQTFAYYDPGLKSFHIADKGSTTGGVARFDPLGVGPGGSLGNFLNYSFGINVGGVNGSATGVFGPFSTPDPGEFQKSSDGFFQGVFQNTNGSKLFYNVDLQINGNSSVNFGGGPNNLLFPNGSIFGSDTVIPEPASCLTFAMVFAASAGFGWRRSRQRRADALANA
jgi:hypothetical protein